MNEFLITNSPKHWVRLWLDQTLSSYLIPLSTLLLFKKKKRYRACEYARLGIMTFEHIMFCFKSWPKCPVTCALPPGITLIFANSRTQTENAYKVPLTHTYIKQAEFLFLSLLLLIAHDASQQNLGRFAILSLMVAWLPVSTPVPLLQALYSHNSLIYCLLLVMQISWLSRSQHIGSCLSQVKSSPTALFCLQGAQYSSSSRSLQMPQQRVPPPGFAPADPWT